MLFFSDFSYYFTDLVAIMIYFYHHSVMAGPILSLLWLLARDMYVRVKAWLPVFYTGLLCHFFMFPAENYWTKLVLTVSPMKIVAYLLNFCDFLIYLGAGFTLWHLVTWWWLFSALSGNSVTASQFNASSPCHSFTVDTR